MSESGEPAQFPEADGGGGRSARGPATHVPGETQPGGVVPPYEGRKSSADIDDEDDSQTVEDLTSPKPADTPGGRTASPADEQPAAEVGEGRQSDPGVGPAHIAGTTRGEDIGEGAPHNPGDEDNEGQPASDRPSEPQPDDDTSV